MKWKHVVLFLVLMFLGSVVPVAIIFNSPISFVLVVPIIICLTHEPWEYVFTPHQPTKHKTEGLLYK